MTAEAKYEYRVSYGDDDTKQVDAAMKLWADDGWELLSGSACAWASKEPQTFTVAPPQFWHTRFVMYWRRPRIESDSTMT